MSASLAGAKSFTFESYTVREEMLESGQKVEFSANQKIAVRRPDGAVATVTGDREDYAFVYDGKTVTLFNKLTKSYAQLAARPASWMIRWICWRRSMRWFCHWRMWFLAIRMREHDGGHPLEPGFGDWVCV